MNCYDAIDYPYGWGVDRDDVGRPDLAEPLVRRLSELDPFALEPLGTGEIDADVERALRELGYAGED